ncbi:vWA domain-containing protein [Kallotenue papyrolyticum]|uniref:vWA domain-containing protein n=1 Tax=Kallotenue papyrolyticum TaxID=1325125 RepID=UPI0004AE8909|nr:VWA domain-containing protein [Kallotenue papyrolyticum]
MFAPSGHLRDQFLAFGRLLRQFGVAVDPGQMLDLLAALELINIGRREDVYLTCRAILVRRREDLPVFDEAWRFFFAMQRQGLPLGPALPDERMQFVELPRRLMRARDTAPAERPRDEQQEIEIQLSYSQIEQLRHKDFAHFTADELDQARALLAQLGYRMALRTTRRWRAGRGAQIDPRRSLRHALRSGGELVQLLARQRRQRQRPLVVLCDISGSMDRYSRILIQFVHTLSAGLHNVETFVFGTRLTRITRQLAFKDVDEAVDAVSAVVCDWGGGTRIGEAMRCFNFEWGRRVLGRGALVLIISDGWDRGDPELLGQEMARLQRTAYRLIWLNPLLGMPGYAPLTRGMQAALPYVDEFLPVHNLASLEQLGEKLATALRR